MRYLASCCRLVARVGISMRIDDRIVARLCVGVRAGIRGMSGATDVRGSGSGRK